MQRNYDQIKSLNADILAISVDPPEVSKDFSKRLGLKYQLLSDENLSAIKDYGVVDGVLGIAKPATFILDKNGIIRWKYAGSDKTDRVHSEIIIEKLKSFNADSSAPWDVNADGKVDIFDLVLVAKNIGEVLVNLVQVEADNSPNPDVNGDKSVDILDLVLVASHFGENIN